MTSQTRSRVLFEKREEMYEENASKIVYTYIHDHNKCDLKLLKLWEQTWSSYGYEPHVLTLTKHAKLHPKYDTFIRFIKKAGVCCSVQDAYLGRLAMAAIKTGGYYSDLHVLPLNSPQFNTPILQNDEKITSHDILFSSLMSGS